MTLLPRAWASAPSTALLGSLLETIVAHDVMASAEASFERIVVRHWRDNRNQKEVDLVLVHPDGRLVGIEVKSASTVGPGDTLGLQAFAEDAGDACHRLAVVYDGDRVIDLTPRNSTVQIVALPRTLL
jgi:uncharacterized protein